MLEQMLAQFSYANFAYVVMSEMEPYLSELFIELQGLQKEAADEDSLDKEGMKYHFLDFGMGLYYRHFSEFLLEAKKIYYDVSNKK